MGGLKAGALVFLGGGAGACARYFIGEWVAARTREGFPWGTWLVNVSGSLLIGLVIGALGKPGTSPEARLLLAAGLCGGYTTFSAFSLETVRLLQQRQMGVVAAYVGSSIAVCALACWIGLTLAKSVSG